MAVIRSRAAIGLLGLSLMAALAMELAPALATPPHHAVRSDACDQPDPSTADRWAHVNEPPEAIAGSIQPLDRAACVLVALDRAHHHWRSTDGGGHWRDFGSSPKLDRLYTEHLEPSTPLPFVGRVLATGPASTTGIPQVYVSDDGGKAFVPVMLRPSSNATGVAEKLVPLQGHVVTAATAVRVLQGVRQPYVYLAARPPVAPGAAASTERTTLLRSNDGGHTFEPLASAARLSPTAISVNPVIPDEIWINNGTVGTGDGGVWVSLDGGDTFSSTGTCCTGVHVLDVAVGVSPNGRPHVVLATDRGLLRSRDDGRTWRSLTANASAAVGLAPDDVETIAVQESGRVLVRTGSKTAFRPRSGLPQSCRPRHLRSSDVTPTRMLVDCESAGTFVLALVDYASKNAGQSGAPVPLPPGPEICKLVSPCAPDLLARQMRELATWPLPDADQQSGALAFDGHTLYYDTSVPGRLGRVRASDGRYLGTSFVQLDAPKHWSLTADLRKRDLLIISPDLVLFRWGRGHDRPKLVGNAFYKAPSFDPGIDGLSWIPEAERTLYRLQPGQHRPHAVCTIPPNGLVSTYVAAGDGGGYLQDEDDQHITRIDAQCRVTGYFAHRKFAESAAENDSLACDTQTFFPQAAIWIRDSQPRTITAYAVPAGYCPMPSTLRILAPSTAAESMPVTVCAELRNTATGEMAVDRNVTLTAAGRPLEHGQTDANGRFCTPYPAVDVARSRLQVPLSATFAGDASLYPSSAHGVLTVLGGAPPVSAPPQAAVAAPPPLPPVVPPHPGANPGPGPASAHEVAPNPAQAPQGQMQQTGQQLLQAVSVPQRQHQPQLALARAAARVDLANEMVAVRPRRPIPLGTAGAGALLVAGCALAGLLSRNLAFSRRSSR